MEFFSKAKAVKLRSLHDKYLVADDDRENVRQSRRGGSSRKARWYVELVEDKTHVVRLKSCHGRYLTASDMSFLLGMTGKKVLQTSPEKLTEPAIEWEPMRDGFQVKLCSWCGKYLRANGGTPPWRNSVTHDEPHSSATQKWILWDVEEVEVKETDLLTDYLSSMSSFSSVSEDVLGSVADEGLEDSEPGSPVTSAVSMNSPNRFSIISMRSPRLSVVWSKSPRLFAKKQLQPQPQISNKFRTGMDLFHNAKAVRLRSHHDKYLLAEEDEESVTQDRKGSSKNARWVVEPVPDSDSIVRLKSCYNKYLTASNQPFLLGMTGRKVLQTNPRRPDSSVEWEPIREGSQMKLKTRYGQFLRANGGLPPWRNSVTHDIPHRTATQDWVLWDVDIVEIQVQSPGDNTVAATAAVDHSDSMGSESSSPSSVSIKSENYSRQESSDSYVDSPPKLEGRTIHYHIADENGEVDEESTAGYSLSFKGNGVAELTRKLEEETGLEGIVVCTRSPLNGQLYPLRLQLPPNTTTLHLIIVQSSSTGAKDYAKQGNPL